MITIELWNRQAQGLAVNWGTRGYSASEKPRRFGISILYLLFLSFFFF